MALFARFTPQRRALQLMRYGLRKGTKVFERVNPTNRFLAKQFDGMQIDCNVCGETARLWFTMLSTKDARHHNVGYLRETLECLNCLSRMRYRIMAHALLRECRERFCIQAASVAELAQRIDHVDILDTDAFSPASRILRCAKTYKTSTYFPDRPAGFVPERNTYNIDLQAIAFPDQSFDIILSTDVMEHVRHLERAHQEIFRCLKPGGAHIFTVPFDDERQTTKILIDTSSPEDIYLEPPQMHGDDHLSGGIPAYRMFGLDLLDDLQAHGYHAEVVKITLREAGVFGGHYFIARRPM